ncbi:MAG TPA: hypothetical protein VMB03_28460 [Bryobacteraceae bacterium]|nr:hypothetical protein [Bryobacteraceae bacterium]
MLKTPELKLNLMFPYEAIDRVVKDQSKPDFGKLFDKKFDEMFNPKFQAMSTERMKKVQEAVDWTEARIPQKNTIEEREKLVETANNQLKQAFAVWQAELQKLCDECVLKAYDAAVKAVKAQVLKAQIKSVAKIVLISVLVLAGAGLAIAAVVASHGALAPLILTAVLKGATALSSVYKVYKRHWHDCGTTIQAVHENIVALDKAVESYKKAVQTGGTIDKAKAFVAGLKAPVTMVKTNAEKLDLYIPQIHQTLEQQKVNLNKIAQDGKDSEQVKKAVSQAVAAIDKANTALGSIRNIKIEAMQALASYEKQELPNLGKLKAAVDFAQRNSADISAVGTVLSTTFGVLKDVGVPVPV